jgi:hypothetical protein
VEAAPRVGAHAAQQRSCSSLAPWDFPKLNPNEHLTTHFGLVSDFLSECWSRLRDGSRLAAMQNRIHLGGALSGRDIEGVNKTPSSTATTPLTAIRCRPARCGPSAPALAKPDPASTESKWPLALAVASRSSISPCPLHSERAPRWASKTSTPVPRAWWEIATRADMSTPSSCARWTTTAAVLAPECGHQFRPEKRQLVTVAGELKEVSQQELRRERRREQSQARTAEQLEALGAQRGMKNPRGWARYVIASRQTRGQWGLLA